MDIENLQENAQQVVLDAITSWPTDFPRPQIMKLYVKADQVELWKFWAGHHIPSIVTYVKGVQHFTYNGSKNSADLSLSLDALADWLKGRAKYIAVISDDSDFASLFAVIKQETVRAENPKLPFKWFMTDRTGTRSQMLADFFPTEYIHVISNFSVEDKINDDAPAALSIGDSGSPANSEQINGYISAAPSVGSQFSENELIARSIIQNLSVGTFKSTDCKKVIVKYFPTNNLGKADSANFGTQFAKLIWPVLQKYGVREPNPNRKPRRYEITMEAKKTVG